MTAYDCGKKRAADDAEVEIQVKPTCKPSWQGEELRSEALLVNPLPLGLPSCPFHSQRASLGARGEIFRAGLQLSIQERQGTRQGQNG